jgi:Dna[CI] antecedent, DciA
MSRPMEQAGAALEKVVATGLRRAPAGQGPVLAWALACGHAVAMRTRSLDFAQGILRVEVPDWGWRAELQALAPQYLAVINRCVAESVKRIEFVVGDSHNEKNGKAADEGAGATSATRI